MLGFGAASYVGIDISQMDCGDIVTLPIPITGAIPCMGMGECARIALPSTTW